MTAGAPAPEARAAPDGLDAFVARHRNRGDGYWWLLGVGGTIYWGAFLAGGVYLHLTGHRGNVYDRWSFAAFGVAVVCHLAYLLRRPWSRVAVLFPYPLTLATEAYAWWAFARTSVPPLPLRPDAGTVLHEAIVTALFLVPALLALTSPLNRLAFGLEVPRARLEAARIAYQRNRLAVSAAVLAAACAIVPVGFVIALPAAVTAWWRSREPGVGHAGAARVALWLCGAGLLWTVAFFTLAA